VILFVKKFFDDFIKGSTPILYHIVIVGFSAALALSLPTAVRFMARQFLLYWSQIGQVRREKMNETKTEGFTHTDPANHMILRNIREGEETETFSPLWPNECRVFPGDFPFAGRQNFQSGLHPGGKEFSLLRSKNPICETAGWIAIL
jgi:hypothetical protein